MATAVTTGTATSNHAKVVQRRVKTGCLTCRKRHMKCDERRPKCRHCEIAGRTCSFPSGATLDSLAGLDPDATTFDFPSDHVWLETASALRFVYQVRYIHEDEESESPDEAPFSGRTIETALVTPDTSAIADSLVRPSSHVATVVSPHVVVPPATYFSPGGLSEGQLTSLTADSPALSLHSNLSIYTARPRAPLEDPIKAQLMRHYIDNLTGWLDLNDPKHHFSISVPHLALTCPMLLDAILAFSARHLSRVNSSYDSLLADQYHDSCVHRLIPALQDLSLATESALPLSTVILRMHEMLGSETDFQRHLRGCISLFRYNRNKFRPGSLQHTAFWTYVRQEILTALPNGSPTNIDTTDRTYYVVFVENTDEDWTNHITWIAAKVINHCFGPQLGVGEGAAERWEALQRDVDGWRERAPDTFRPLSVVRDDRPFPVTTYLCTWHVIGLQFFHLCKVLLALHYPLQTTGINLLRFVRLIETEIAEHTNQLCGIVRGLTTSTAPTSRYPGTLVNATELLAICGRTLKDRAEQLSVLQMLHQIEVETAWPVERAIRNLEDEWDRQIHN